MPRKSRKLAARQAALAGRRKLKRQPKSRPEPIQPVATSDVAQEETSEPVEQTGDAANVGTGPAELGAAPEPVGTIPEVATAAPWPYAYVVRDVKRIGIFSVGIFITIGILAVVVG